MDFLGILSNESDYLLFLPRSLDLLSGHVKSRCLVVSLGAAVSMTNLSKDKLFILYKLLGRDTNIIVLNQYTFG